MHTHARTEALRVRLADGIDARSFYLKILLTLTGAYLTALAARVVIPLPLTPVPITGQVFMVLLIAGMVRPGIAASSQIVYVVLGLLGLPWYAGGGTFKLVTAGYLAGFVAAAMLVPALMSRESVRRSLLKTALALAAGVGVIYLFGAAHLAILYGGDVKLALQTGVMPFLIPDAIKLALAAAIVYTARRPSRKA